VKAVVKAAILLAAGALAGGSAAGEEKKDAGQSLELSRAVRTWEFLPVTGQRAGLLGNEAGRMEAWVYPLKIFRDFHLKFLTEARALPAEALARTVTVRPESATILYAGDTFRVAETFFVPVKEQGAVILFEVETEQPLEIEAAFHRDFQLEWPAALGGTYLEWGAAQHAFYFGEEQRKFVALVGSPTATDPHLEFQTNYAEAEESSLRLGVTAKGRERKLIMIAGSLEGRAAAEKTYEHLKADFEALRKESAKYYRDYLARTVTLDLPDKELERAYDWSRVSLAQGVVTNPTLGTGLVAGYRTSGVSQRPGFAWYFGRDSEWTSLALNAMGDFATTRTALEFIGKHQREDGKIPHEISQGASFVNWFKDYPYAYASADATPLYIIATADYVRWSGDADFARENWERLEKAYKFLRASYDAKGLPKNFGVGHGWVEGGPLLPVETEYYQSGLGAVAVKALSNLALAAEKKELSEQLRREAEKQEMLVNQSFWIEEKKRIAFALDKNGKPVDEPSVLTTAPMWFGLTEDTKAISMIQQLSAPDHQTDWGMRIISNRSLLFSGGGYHYGSAWPLFTGWASVAEYRYHQEFSAYANLRANALLALDGSYGHVTEVLSGDYYQPLSTSSPHQIWSAAMVTSPILRGMLGLETSAVSHSVTFTPHVPADWTQFRIENLPVGHTTLRLSYRKTKEGIFLEVERISGDEECVVEFSPAVSLRAKVKRAEVDGKTAPYRSQPNATDQHVFVRLPVGAVKSSLRILLQNEFGLSYNSQLPGLGETSSGLRIVSETWSDSESQLTLEAFGIPGQAYRLPVWNPAEIQSVEGAKMISTGDAGTLLVQLPGDGVGQYTRGKIVLRFGEHRGGNRGVTK